MHSGREGSSFILFVWHPVVPAPFVEKSSNILYRGEKNYYSAYKKARDLV